MIHTPEEALDKLRETIPNFESIAQIICLNGETVWIGRELGRGDLKILKRWPTTSSEIEYAKQQQTLLPRPAG